MNIQYQHANLALNITELCFLMNQILATYILVENVFHIGWGSEAKWTPIMYYSHLGVRII